MSKISLSELNLVLVEPSDTQTKIIKELLAKEGVNQVDSVYNVEQAKTVILRNKPDLVVSAMYFPDGSGMEILKAIKLNPETVDIPFMLVSSENRSEKLEQFKQAGVAAILPKPFSTDNLQKALSATLDLLNTEELDLELFDVNDVRVLMVDHSQLARNHMRRVLEGLGLKDIHEAEDGASALTLLNDNTYDLVVTDFNMPEMDGRELSEFIRFNPHTAHVPIIMVTSESTDSPHMANIHQAGVNALCDKPYEVDEVKRMMVSLLGS